MNAALPIRYPAVAHRAAAPAPAKPAEAKPAAVESDDVDESKVTWGQAFKGLAGAVAVAGEEAVGNTATSLIELPKATYHTYRALIKTPQIGPVLKTSLAMLLPAAVVAAPVLTALGSVGFGLWRGFSQGVEHGVGKAVEKGAHDIKFFHKEMAGKLVKSLSDYEVEPLRHGQKPYDINVVGGVKGLAAGVVSGTIDGAGVGLSTLAHTPQGLVQMGKALWKSHASLPLKVVGTALLAPAAVVAAPLALVGGAVYGIGVGAHDGYTKGFGPAVSNATSTVNKFNHFVGEDLKDM